MTASRQPPRFFDGRTSATCELCENLSADRCSLPSVSILNAIGTLLSVRFPSRSSSTTKNKKANA